MSAIKAIWQQSLEEFLIYRGTSIITFILAAVFLLIELFTGKVYFSQGENLAGWTANRYFIMISFMNSAVYLYNLFFILGHESLGDDILEGNLDYLLVRPSSSYWLAVGRSLDVPSFFLVRRSACPLSLRGKSRGESSIGGRHGCPDGVFNLSFEPALLDPAILV